MIVLFISKEHFIDMSMLDSNRRSLFAGVVNLRSMKGREMVFAYFNYGTELYQLLELIAGTTKARLQVLFQHPPSPSLVTRNSISCAGRDCANAMLGAVYQRRNIIMYLPTLD